MSTTANKKVFANNLEFYLSVAGKEQSDIAKLLGVSNASVSDWINAKKYPRIDRIEALADCFGITISDLVQERTEERCASQAKNDTLSNIILRLRSDDVFFDTVEKLNTLEEEKLVSVSTLISTFTK